MKRLPRSARTQDAVGCTGLRCSFDGVREIGGRPDQTSDNQAFAAHRPILLTMQDEAHDAVSQIFNTSKTAHIDVSDGLLLDDRQIKLDSHCVLQLPMAARYRGKGAAGNLRNRSRGDIGTNGKSSVVVNHRVTVPHMPEPAEQSEQVAG